MFSLPRTSQRTVPPEAAQRILCYIIRHLRCELMMGTVLMRHDELLELLNYCHTITYNVKYLLRQLTDSDISKAG